MFQFLQIKSNSHAHPTEDLPLQGDLLTLYFLCSRQHAETITTTQDRNSGSITDVDPTWEKGPELWITYIPEGGMGMLIQDQDEVSVLSVTYIPQVGIYTETCIYVPESLLATDIETVLFLTCSRVMEDKQHVYWDWTGLLYGG